METEIYNQVKVSVKQLINIDLTYYKDEQMRRRLDAWLLRVNTASWDEYFTRLLRDGKELARFRDYLTINVSEFFRDLERWNYLSTHLLPDLLTGAGLSGIKAWSCGCSLGQEPYSLAMLLDEVAPRRQHELLATDIDRGALDCARARGPYQSENLANITPAQRERYFEPGGPPYYVRKELSRRVNFYEHNLFADAFKSGFDLIICRNVIIYFTQEGKSLLYRKFHQALRPGGVLFLGGTEIIHHCDEVGFRSKGYSFYVKEKHA